MINVSDSKQENMKRRMSGHPSTNGMTEHAIAIWELSMGIRWRSCTDVTFRPYDSLISRPNGGSACWIAAWNHGGTSAASQVSIDIEEQPQLSPACSYMVGETNHLPCSLTSRSGRWDLYQQERPTYKFPSINLQRSYGHSIWHSPVRSFQRGSFSDR